MPPTTPTEDPEDPATVCHCQQVPRLTVVPGGSSPPDRRIRIARTAPCPRCATPEEPAAAPTTERLLLWAEQLLEAHGPRIAGRWARAAAMLSRQALESILAARGATVFPAAHPAVVGHPAGSSLPVAVDRSLGDELLTARVDHTWRTLSRACAQPDETAPTAAQLRRWLDSVHAIDAALATVPTPDPTPWG